MKALWPDARVTPSDTQLLCMSQRWVCFDTSHQSNAEYTQSHPQQSLDNMFTRLGGMQGKKKKKKLEEKLVIYFKDWAPGGSARLG